MEDTKNKITLLSIYLKALEENLTAKQAGAKYGVRHDSLCKCKNRYGLMSLRNEWDFALESRLDKMGNSQILSYWKVLKLNQGSKYIREIKVCKLILEKRSLSII